MDDRHLIWRATLRPAPGLPLRTITWDIQLRGNGIAVAGLRRTDDGPWQIDQIRSKENTVPSQALLASVKAWHANHSVNRPPEIIP